MARLILALAILAIPTLASALITPTAQIRDIDCYASGGNFEGTEFEELDDATSAVDFGIFDEAVGETVVPSNSLGSGTAIQNSNFGATTITAMGSASANAEAYDFDWWASADGSSVFDIVFQLDIEVDYNLSGLVAAFDNGTAFVELQTEDGTTIFYADGFGETPFNDTGSLQAGSYRLTAEASGSCYADGFVFDYAFAEYDLSFNVSGATASPAVRGFAMSAVPNPVRESTTVFYSLQHDAPAQIDIFDARGRLTRHMDLRQAAEGAVIWDGRDGNGNRVPRGIYYLRLRSGEQTAQQKLAVLR